MASAGKDFPMKNWAQLLPELLQSIAKRIHSYEDFVAFGNVCMSWRSVAKLVQIPWLMLAEDEGGSDTRGFSSLRNDGVMVHRVNLPEARGKHCIGSMGWLITVDEKANAELLHPLTRARISLPHPTTYRDYKEGEGQMNLNKLMIRRAALSASPLVTDDYALMVIIGSKCYAALWKPGESSWTLVQRDDACLDVIYYRDRFFCLFGYTTIERDVTAEIGHGEGNAYLVESPGGDLLVVSRQRDFNDDGEFCTCSFTIYKFDPIDMKRWKEIDDLKGAAVFVGHSAATAVAATVAGIRPNCIYFTDDHTNGYVDMENPDNIIGGRDMGIYNFETRTVEPLPAVVTSLSNYCPPIWVFPSF